MSEFVTRTLSIPTNGIHLHAECSGPQDGPLVILLHGFPEMWYGWRGQIGALARVGFFVVVPDQRGYNLSDKPAGVEHYTVETLARDITGIIDHFGRQKAFVAGHDWGAAVAWHLAIQHPERVERLAILNVPHPAALAHAFTQPVWEQLKRSWYIYFFQIPALPEFLLSAGGYAGLARMLRVSSRPGTFDSQDLRRYREAWSRPGALTGMINWYRAAVRGMLRAGRDTYLREAGERVVMPTLILWGDRDIALIPELAQWSAQWCDQVELVRFPDATHWVQHDQAELVASKLVDFFR